VTRTRFIVFCTVAYGVIVLLGTLLRGLTGGEQPLTAGPELTQPGIAPPTAEAVLAANLPVNADGLRQHVIQRGDTLSRLSRLYNVSVEAIAQANNLSNTDSIYAGQVLLIPVNSLANQATAISVTATSTDEENLVPTEVSSLTPFPLPGATAPAPVYPPNLNGIPLDQVLVINPAVEARVRLIYGAGVALGRDPRAFSKLGDSTIENPHFLSRFDQTAYNLADYSWLQYSIDYYRGSFGRQGVAVRRGLHSWAVFDPMWAVDPACTGAETVFTCELRLHNPSILFIKLGANDVGVPESFQRSMERLINTCIEAGVIPILSTKADRHEGSNINNEIIRELAVTYNLPLLDFDLLAETLPGRGLAPDGVHLSTFFAHDWRLPSAYQRGYGLYNLTALMLIDAVRRAASA
jgi:LysM repeat protein